MFESIQDNVPIDLLGVHSKIYMTEMIYQIRFLF